ncbi:MAG: hypothetical protein M1839_006846 [Geoglossum umbratile]|nr:MAG: hypothetical protein M1839_006846 [Geoglossum umbratile]
MAQGTTTSTAVIGGKEIEVAVLETVDLACLATREPTEVKKLLGAAQYPGIFFLDLQNDASAKQALADLPSIYESSEKYFDQPHDQKMRDYRKDQEPGYKQSNCDETFEITYDETSKGTPIPPNHILTENAALLKQFTQTCHTICHTMLAAFSSVLALSPPDLLQSSHSPTAPSDSGLKLISEPSLARLADVGENKHTDRGTFTLLFHDCWGLHIELPNEGKWAFTAPPAQGCVLVNVADSLERLSGGQLRSPIHRVTQPADGAAGRHFISYFLRPDNALKEAWARE